MTNRQGSRDYSLKSVPTTHPDGYGPASPAGNHRQNSRSSHHHHHGKKAAASLSGLNAQRAEGSFNKRTRLANASQPPPAPAAAAHDIPIREPARLLSMLRISDGPGPVAHFPTSTTGREKHIERYGVGNGSFGNYDAYSSSSSSSGGGGNNSGNTNNHEGRNWMMEQENYCGGYWNWDPAMRRYWHLDEEDGELVIFPEKFD